MIQHKRRRVNNMKIWKLKFSLRPFPRLTEQFKVSADRKRKIKTNNLYDMTPALNTTSKINIKN